MVSWRNYILSHLFIRKLHLPQRFE